MKLLFTNTWLFYLSYWFSISCQKSEIKGSRKALKNVLESLLFYISIMIKKFLMTKKNSLTVLADLWNQIYEIIFLFYMWLVISMYKKPHLKMILYLLVPHKIHH